MRMENYFKNAKDGAVSINIDEHNSCSKNSLLCGVCNEIYSKPCLLACYHSFCRRCLGGPHFEEKVLCPTCG